MKVTYVTCAENGLYGLKHLVQSGVDIEAVVTISPEVAERANVSGYVDVSAYVEAQGIRLVQLTTYQLKVDDLAGVDSDLLIVNGWNRLISQSVIDAHAHGGLGIHAGHPPIGLGRAPLVWNMLLGHADIEVYVFKLSATADDGEIQCRATVGITQWDTIQMLYEKVMFVGSRLFEEAARRIASGQSGQPQMLEHAKFYEQRKPSDGLIDFSMNELQIYNFVRAQGAPYPGAFAYLDGKMWHIWQAVPFDSFAFRDRVRVPGEIVAALPTGIVVLTGGAPVWVTSASCEDGRSLPDSLGQMEQMVGSVFAPISD